ncbi:MAG: permease [Clostridia bacterium]|nr:permease [Clostridia bacterium]
MLNGFLYFVVLFFLLFSLVKDGKKTKMALKKAWKSMMKNIMMIMGMMILMGVVFKVIDPETIGSFFGKESGLFGIFAGLGIGSFAFIPSFIAFPLGAQLIENGAGYPQVAGFISSLMGVGLISITMEVEYFGKQAAITRNAFAVLASVVFVVLVGVII